MILARTAAPASVPPGTPRPPAWLQRAAERLVDAWRAEHDVPGIAVSIRQAGQPILDVARGSGRFVTSAPDLARYAEGLLWKGGATQTSTARAKMIGSIEDNSARYGYGVFDQAMRPNDPVSFGHNGRTFGSLAEVVHVPRTQQTLAALLNSDNVGSDAVAELFRDLRTLVKQHDRHR